MISVIIPVFNREKTIKESIESVLQQTISDIEIIVVDDGSTDNSADIIKSIDDSRIKYIYQSNSGACVARNRGIEAAKGKIIAFHDSDDCWVKVKLERQIQVLNETKADIVFCQLNEDGRCVPETLNEGYVGYEEFLSNGNLIGTPTILGKRECFENVKFDPEMPRLQDREIAIRLSQHYKVYFMKQPLVVVNTQADSISCNDSKGIIAIRRIIEKNQDYLSRHPKVENLLLSNLAWYLIREDVKCDKEFLKQIKNEPSVKNIIKYISYKFGLLGKRYKRQGKPL